MINHYWPSLIHDNPIFSQLETLGIVFHCHAPDFAASPGPVLHFGFGRLAWKPEKTSRSSSILIGYDEHFFFSKYIYIYTYVYNVYIGFKYVLFMNIIYVLLRKFDDWYIDIYR